MSTSAIHVPLAARIADFVSAASRPSLPADIHHIAAQHLLDTLGCCLAASAENAARQLAEYVRAEGGAAQATAIGFPDLMPAAQAAWLNGQLARALEYDDMALPDLHPSGVVLPAVLALAEWQGASGAAVLAAYIVGVELCLRIGRAAFDRSARVSRFLARGQDATAITGAVAAAAVAAKLLGLDARGIADAIGIAVSFASGSLESNRSGGTIKQYQSGWAAKSAVQAACLAKAGVSGPAQAFEGRYGFYQCFVDGAFDAEMLAGDLGSRWESLSLRFKPYPSNYYTHAGIDAALRLRKRGLLPSQVAAAELAVATPMRRTMGEPIERKQQPRSAYEAKFSGPYTVASALIGGECLGLGIGDFSPALINEPARIQLMRRINVTSTPECDAIFPDQAPAVLSVTTTGGEELVERALVNRGSAGNPLTDAELATKFTDNAGRAMPREAAQALREAIGNLGEGGSLTSVTAMLRTARRGEPGDGQVGTAASGG